MGLPSYALAAALVAPAVAPPPPAEDPDGDGVTAALEAAMALAGPDEAVPVLLGLRSPPGPALAARVEAAGCRVTGRFERLVHLLTCEAAPGSWPAVLAVAGPELTYAGLDGPVVGTALNATRLVRARDVWRGAVPGLPGLTGAGARVGLVDSGVDDGHPALRGKVDRWLDVAGPRADGQDLYAEPFDRRGHGTAVASVAAGAGGQDPPGVYQITMSRRFPPEEGAGWTQSFPMSAGAGGGQVRFLAEWGAGAVALSVRDEAGETVLTAEADGPPMAWAGEVPPGAGGRRWQAFFFTRRQDAVDTRDTSYFAALQAPFEPLDDFPLLAGVAPDAFVAACKALDDTARAGGAGFVIRCLEWMAEVAGQDGLAAVNLSLNLGGDGGPLDTAVNALVRDHGVSVVVSAGNDQQDGVPVRSPGTAALAVTVGAHNTEGRVTLYSSLGAPGPPGAGPDKPDVVAPGGSLVEGSPFLVADANDAHCKAQDWECGRDADPYPDDVVGAIGTSLAAPVVAGAMALLAGAREGGGVGDPLEAKALLLMTALETGDVREVNAEGEGGAPVLGESPGPAGGGDAPWDRVEGYGRVSVEAFLEAATAAAPTFPAGGELSAAWGGRQVWARRVSVPAGETHRFAVFPPPGVGYSLAGYRARPDDAGRPLPIGTGVAVAVVAGEGPVEAVLVVRRQHGEGAFTVGRTVRPSERCAGFPGAAEGAPAEAEFCLVGLGGCERRGRVSCQADASLPPGAPEAAGWAVCETQAGQRGDELCGDGVDNDCDGVADEDDGVIGEPCDTGLLGPCGTGVRMCVDGLLDCVEEVAPAEVEACDGLDDDCDGGIDEDYEVGAACVAGEGACRRSGVLVCAEAGDQAVCDAVAGPSAAERCGDGQDNDCDGQTDEGFEGLGEACTAGIGACAVAGVKVCGGFSNVVCGAQPLPPGDEVCRDGVDGDCDGQVDEGCAPEGGGGGADGCACAASPVGAAPAAGSPLLPARAVGAWLRR